MSSRIDRFPTSFILILCLTRSGYNTSRPPVLNPICGKTAQVTCTWGFPFFSSQLPLIHFTSIDQDKSVTVMLTDRCHDICHGVDDLELSPHAFGQLADISEGKISGISWKILD